MRAHTITKTAANLHPVGTITMVVPRVSPGSHHMHQHVLFCPFKCEPDLEIRYNPVLIFSTHVTLMSGCHMPVTESEYGAAVQQPTLRLLCRAVSSTRGDHTLCHEYFLRPAAASLHPGLYTLQSAFICGQTIHIYVCYSDAITVMSFCNICFTIAISACFMHLTLPTITVLAVRTPRSPRTTLGFTNSKGCGNGVCVDVFTLMHLLAHSFLP